MRHYQPVQDCSFLLVTTLGMQACRSAVAQPSVHIVSGACRSLPTSFCPLPASQPPSLAAVTAETRVAGDPADINKPDAVQISSAVTPPGFYTDIVAKTTQICPDHSYRTDWLPPTQAEAQQCIACGTGVKAEKTDRVIQFLPNGTEVQVSVTSSTDDCCKYLPPSCLTCSYEPALRTG